MQRKLTMPEGQIPKDNKNVEEELERLNDKFRSILSSGDE